jgi:hypothetical protein
MKLLRFDVIQHQINGDFGNLRQVECQFGSHLNDSSPIADHMSFRITIEYREHPTTLEDCVLEALKTVRDVVVNEVRVRSPK